MDGFDDLLAPLDGRNMLTENPFEDPFAKRSQSPDPWTTHQAEAEGEGGGDGDGGFGANSGSGIGDETGFASGGGEEWKGYEDHAQEDTRKGYDDDNNAGFGAAESENVISVDPLDASTATSQVVESSSSSAGFRFDWQPHADEPPVPITPVPAHTESAHIHESARIDERAHVHESAHTDERVRIGSPLNRTTAPPLTASTSDSDDDTPIAQSSKFRSVSRLASPRPQTPQSPQSQIQSHHSQPQSQPTQPQTEPVFVITVDDPQRVGDPIRAYTMYTVHTNTTSSAFPKSSFSVLRRYSDFLWLYDTLSSNNPGIIVPPVPEKNPFGRFDDGFVQQRRRELQKCVQKIANHPVLVKDADFESFLYSDSFALDIKHRKAESAHERGGLMASIGQTLTGPRFYETDEWFDKQKTYLDGLESQLRGLVKAIDTVAKQRVELSTATGEFAAALSELAASSAVPLSTASLPPSLSPSSSSSLSPSPSSSSAQTHTAQSAAQSAAQTHAALNALADVARTAEAVQSAQAQLDVGGLMSTADEYSRLVNSVRLAFAARIRTYTAWQNADADARRVRARGAGGAGYNDRNGSGFNERSGGGGGGGVNVSMISEADRRALDAKHAFDTATRRIKAELGRFEAERVEDFKRALAALLAGMIRGQGEVIAAWERYQGLLLKPSSASSLGAGVVA